MQVNGVVFSPAEWKEKEEGHAVAGKPVVFAETETPGPASPPADPFYVGDPWYAIAAIENVLTKAITHWEVLAVAELSEPGAWRIVVTSGAPLKSVEPDLITVQPTGEL